VPLKREFDICGFCKVQRTREPEFATYLLRLIEKYIRLKRFLELRTRTQSFSFCQIYIRGTEENVTAP
jgi:hypothetical protein